jgi:hypothetical protein
MGMLWHEFLGIDYDGSCLRQQTRDLKQALPNDCEYTVIPHGDLDQYQGL